MKQKGKNSLVDSYKSSVFSKNLILYMELKGERSVQSTDCSNVLMNSSAIREEIWSVVNVTTSDKICK